MKRGARNPVDSSLPANVEGFDLLAALALDMRWSWDHRTDEVAEDVGRP